MGRNRGQRGVEDVAPYGFVRNLKFVRGRGEIVDNGPSRTSAPTGWCEIGSLRTDGVKSRRLLTRLSTSLRELSIHPPSQGRDS